MTHPQSERCMVSPRQMQAAVRLYEEDATLRACITTIQQSIMSGGIHVDGSSEEVEFQQHLNEKWLPFLEECFLSFMLFGFCPYRIHQERLSDGVGGRPSGVKVRYPVALALGTYSIWVHLEKDKRLQLGATYAPVSALAPLSEHDDPSIHVLRYSGTHTPTVDGGLRSRVHMLRVQLRPIWQLWECALLAESQRSNPAIYTEQSSLASTQVEPQTLLGLGGGQLGQLDEERRFVRSDRRYKRMLEAEQRTDAKSDKRTKRGERRVVPLPEGEKLAANVPRAEARTDLVELERLKNDLICRTFSVPKSMFGGEQSHQKAGAAGVAAHSKTFKMAVDYNRGVLTATMARLHAELYPKRQANLASPRALSLPGAPILEFDAIRYMYDQHIISASTMMQWTLRRAGASTNDLDPSGLRHVERLQKLLRKRELTEAAAPIEVVGAPGAPSAHPEAKAKANAISDGKGVEA